MRISDWSSDVCSSDLLAQVPGDAGAAQHRAGHAPGKRLFRRDHADAHGALLPDAIVRQQDLVFVDALREVLREGFQVIEHRTLAPGVEALELAALAPLRLAVLRHAFGQVAIDADRKSTRLNSSH